MTLELQKWSDDLLIPFFNKMNGNSLCKLRRTCKTMNHIVQRNHVHINARVPLLTLLIRIKQRNHDQPKMDVFVCNCIHDRCLLNIVGDKYVRKSRIQFPLAQLSGVSFETLVVRSSELSTEEQAKSLFALLRKLRISCDWLHLFGLPRNLMEKVISLVSFKQIIFFNCNGVPQIMQSKRIQNCRDLVIFDREGISFDLQPIVLNHPTMTAIFEENKSVRNEVIALLQTRLNPQRVKDAVQVFTLISTRCDGRDYSSLNYILTQYKPYLSKDIFICEGDKMRFTTLNIYDYYFLEEDQFHRRFVYQRALVVHIGRLSTRFVRGPFGRMTYTEDTKS